MSDAAVRLRDHGTDSVANRRGMGVGPLAAGLTASVVVLVSAFSSGLLAQALVVPALIAVILLPGWFLLIALRSNRSGTAETLIESLALSLAVDMAVALILNTTLPAFGDPQPLSRGVLASMSAIIILATSGVAQRYGTGADFTAWAKRPNGVRYNLPSHTAVLLAVSTALVPASVVGAHVLNVGGPAAPSIITESAALLLAVVAVLNRHSFGPLTLCWVLFCQCLSLLLLTALRGQYITGHDILYEFDIFRTTLAHSRWSMHYEHDPYNACLSLTILPVLIVRDAPGLNSEWVFRVIDQVICAAIPIGSFCLARRFVSVRYAYVAGFSFLVSAFLIRDFPYITRQEIGLFFFTALVLGALRHPSGSLARRIVLPLLCFGLAVSHYSTAYTVVVIFVTAMLTLSVLRFLRKDRSREAAPLVTWPLTVGLGAGVVIWQAVLTRATGDLGPFVDAATKSFGGSGSVFAGTPPYRVLLQHFLRSKIGSTCCGHHPLTYSGTSYASYRPALKVSEVIQSSLSTRPTALLLGVGNVARLGSQLLMVLGTGLLLMRAFNDRIRTDISALAAGALAVALGAEFIPAVAKFYSPLRLYQQSLLVLGLSFVVVAEVILKRLPARLRFPALSVTIALAFLSSSPISAQFLGSPEASLQFNNFGLYYDLYYVHSGDLAAVRWLDSNAAPGAVIFADRFATRKIVTFSSKPLVIVDNVLPQNITSNAYVFVDVDNLTRGVAYDFIDGVEVPYRFPMQFVLDHKQLVFQGGDVEIFR